MERSSMSGGSALGLRLGRRMARLGEGWLGVAYGPGEAARLWAQAAVVGAREAGVDVMEFGELSRPVFQFAMSITRCRSGIYAAGGEQPVLQVVGEQGLPLSSREEQLLRLSGGEPLPHPGRRELVPGMWELYCSRLQRLAGGDLRSSRCVLRCGDLALQSQARGVLSGLGCQMLSGPVLWLNNTGERLAAFSPDGELISFPRLIRRACALTFAEGRPVALPEGVAPQADAEAPGGRLLRYSLRPRVVDGGQRAARELAAQQLWERDGMMLAVLLLRHQHRGSFDRFADAPWRNHAPGSLSSRS